MPSSQPRVTKNLSPWTGRVFQMLEDGPRPWEEVIADAGSLIPPGLAWREREVSRKWIRDGQTYIPNPKVEVTDDAIRIGQRRLLTHTLWSSMRRGRLVRYEQDGEVWLRIGRNAYEGIPRSPLQTAAARRSIQIARAVPLTPEQRHQRALKGNASMTFEQRSERGKKGAAALTPEQRHERSVKAGKMRHAKPK